MKGTIFKILLTVLLLGGVVWYIAYKGGKSPYYVIMHFPEEVSYLFNSLTQSEQERQDAQMEN